MISEKTGTGNFRTGFDSLNEEYDYQVTEIEGALPADLKGTFFRNGPGRNEVAGNRFSHWFDGDGMISSVTFTGDSIHYKNRYVRTRKFVRESRLGKVLYRGFGTQKPGGFMANALRLPENAANASIVYHAGKLLALWEGGRPWQLDPATLETLGEFDYDGSLKSLQPFSAHGKIDNRTGDYFNFGVQYGPSTRLQLYRIDRQGNMKIQETLKLDFAPLCHDFAMSEDYLIFFFNPLFIDSVWGFLFGFSSIDDSLRWHADVNTAVYVFRKSDLGLAFKTETEPFFAFHYGNAFEEDGKLKVVVSKFTDFSIGDNLRDIFSSEFKQAARLTAYEIDLGSHKVAVNEIPPGMKTDSEFPVFHPEYGGRKNRYHYCAGVVENGSADFFNAVHKLDHDTKTVSTYTLDPGCFNSEAVFVARQGSSKEDEGYLLSFEYDSHRHQSCVLVLDALSMKMISRARLKHHVPYGFHGFFTRDIFE